MTMRTLVTVIRVTPPQLEYESRDRGYELAVYSDAHVERYGIAAALTWQAGQYESVAAAILAAEAEAAARMAEDDDDDEDDDYDYDYDYDE